MKEINEGLVVCFGEVLWDILPTGSHPGGAPMNVAYHLKALGSKPVIISKIGTDKYGEQLVDILAQHGVITEYIQVDFQLPTGLVYADVTNHQEVSYDIVFPSAWDFIESKDEFTALLQQAEYFVYGSLTSRNKTSRNTLYNLLDIAKTNVLDINLRAPHYNQKEIQYLLQRSNILKMNEAELNLITAWIKPVQNIEEQMKLVQDWFNIETVIVTLGGDGAIIINNGSFFRHKGYQITVADTIGSGDAFLAGFLNRKLHGSTMAEALDFASAVGAFVATRHGGCPAYSIEQVLALKTPHSLIVS
jgi:fructokinase